MTRIVFILFFTHFIFGIISCDSQCIGKINPDKEKEYNVKSDIPENKYGDPDFFYKEIQELTIKLGLEKLERGFDSLQIRIWYPERSHNNTLMLISKRTENWEGYLLTFDEEYDVLKKIDTIVNVKCKEIFPENNWREVIQSLFNLDIMTLPDVSSIPGIPGAGADGKKFSVEISTSKLYRFYSYFQPSEFRDIEPVRKMSEIIKLLNKEFHLRQ